MAGSAGKWIRQADACAVTVAATTIQGREVNDRDIYLTAVEARTPAPLHPHHDWTCKYGQMYGKVFIMRRGSVVRDKSGRPVAFGPESVGRGDIILDLQLNPLRRNRNGRRNR